jgi:hypothetical protein
LKGKEKESQTPLTRPELGEDPNDVPAEPSDVEGKEVHSDEHSSGHGETPKKPSELMEESTVPPVKKYSDVVREGPDMSQISPMREPEKVFIQYERWERDRDGKSAEILAGIKDLFGPQTLEEYLDSEFSDATLDKHETHNDLASVSYSEQGEDKDIKQDAESSLNQESPPDQLIITCWHCNTTFPSRMKRHQHLQEDCQSVPYYPYREKSFPSRSQDRVHPHLIEWRDCIRGQRAVQSPPRQRILVCLYCPTSFIGSKDLGLQYLNGKCQGSPLCFHCHLERCRRRKDADRDESSGSSHNSESSDPEPSDPEPSDPEPSDSESLDLEFFDPLSSGPESSHPSIWSRFISLVFDCLRGGR